MSRSSQITDLLPPEHENIQVRNRASSSRWDYGEAALEHMRRVQNEPSEHLLRPVMPPPVEEALLAWAISCYEEGAYADAGVLLEELTHRQAPSLPLLSVHAANLLALGEYEASAAGYQKACSLAEQDPDLLVYWAQAEWCKGDPVVAHRLLQQAKSLFEKQLHPTQTSLLCRELIVQYRV